MAIYFYVVNQTIKNIIAIRDKLNIRPSTIADEFGIDRSSYTKVEKGQRNLEAELLIFLSGIFKMSIDEIVNYHKPKQYKSNDEGGDLQANDSLITYIKQEEEKIEGIYKEALENKNDYIKMLQEQRDFYKTQYEQAKDLLKKQTEELEKQLGLVEEANKLIDKFSAKG